MVAVFQPMTSAAAGALTSGSGGAAGSGAGVGTAAVSGAVFRVLVSGSAAAGAAVSGLAAHPERSPITKISAGKRRIVDAGNRRSETLFITFR